MTTQYPRKSEEAELHRIITQSKKAAFFYVRGRRRVGKSWILKRVAESLPHVFYFSGTKDSTTDTQKIAFAQAWATFSKTSTLIELRKEYLSWKRIFDEITAYALEMNHRITLILDEIQWLAKEGSGCIGSLKEAWIDFERSDRVNVIVCGSSNKFFHDHVGGEEKILRGLQTRSPLQITPVSLGAVRKYYFPRWKNEEIALLYMLIGGIPYYLNQIDPTRGFINAVNRALFSDETIFLTEVDEILGLDFNKLGLRNVKKVLETLAVYGGSQAKVRAHFKLSSSTVSSVFNNLEAYQLIRERPHYGSGESGQRQGREASFYINDYFLNTYFALLQKLSADIQRNSGGRENIFAHRILGSQLYYIPDFSGKAFEHLLRDCIEHYPTESRLYKKLDLSSAQFILSDYSTSTAQIDVVISQATDRVVRAIECKWRSKYDAHWAEQLKAKKLPIKDSEARADFVALLASPSKKSRSDLKKRDVGIIELEDLFEVT